MKNSLLIVLLLVSNQLLPLTFKVENYGAKGDGKTICTNSIQKAIDLCHDAGGGVVELSNGTYISGTIILKSDVNLCIAPGVVLKAVANKEAFPMMKISLTSRCDKKPWKAFVFADSQQNISIYGGGTIDGSGGEACFNDSVPDSPQRPYGLHIVNCKNVSVENITMHSSAFWMQRYFNCSGLRLHKLNVYNHANINNDGLDIDSSDDVIVSDCVIDSSDDALVIKSEGDNATKNIVITNCIISSFASAIKTGTGSVGGFENITISNIVIHPSKCKTIHHPLQMWGGLSGIDLISTDGGPLRNVLISNITMEDVVNPIHIRLGNRLSKTIASAKGDQPGLERLKTIDFNSKQTNEVKKEAQELIVEDIQISNVIARNVGPYPICIVGIECHPIKRVILRDIIVTQAVAGTHRDTASSLDWNGKSYPWIGMYGTKLPAYGIVTNYTEDLKIDNVRVIPATGEPRPFEFHLNRK